MKNGVLFIDGNRCRIVHSESRRLPDVVIPDDSFGHVGVKYECALLIESDPPDPLNRCAMEMTFCFHVPPNDPNGPEIPEDFQPWQLRGNSMTDDSGREWTYETSTVRPVSPKEERYFDTVALQAKTKSRVFTKRQIEARKKSGKNRAVVDRVDVAQVMRLYAECSAAKSSSWRANATAKKCREKGLVRTDLKPITPRNILELIKRENNKK